MISKVTSSLKIH